MSEKLVPVPDGARHATHVDEVERGGVVPFLLEVVDEELDVGSDTISTSELESWVISSCLIFSAWETSYNLGWMGLRSTPVT